MKTSLKILFALSLVFSAIVLMVACVAPQETAAPEESNSDEIILDGELAEQIELTPEEMTLDSAPDPIDVDECLACHTDKARLIATAEEIELVETENEGEG